MYMTEKCIAGKDIKTDTFQNISMTSMTSMTSTITKNMDYKLRALKDLKELCKERQIKGISAKSKEQIIKLLEASDISLLTQESLLPHAQLTQPTQLTLPVSMNLSDMINKIFHAECIEMMQKIPDSSIDMVCTDPPYFLDGLGNDWNKQMLDNKGSSAIVGNLPKGMRFDRNQSKKFNEFYSKVSSEVYRILKPGGAFISFSSPRLYHSMAMAIEDAGFEIRDMLGWIYTQSQVKAFSQNHIIENDKKMDPEQKQALKDACNNWKTPQLKPAIEPMCLAVKPIEGRYIDNFQKYGTGLMNTSEETKTGEGFFPSNIITTDNIEESMDRVFLVSKPNKKEKGEYNTHLSVKPVSLIAHLLKLFSKEGAIILDPFMGSGTTAVACIQSKRKYIGFDINTEYIKITEKRIEEEMTEKATEKTTETAI
jgi:site-specific DNA-methyltransferase (adenine-specific)